MGRVGAQPRLAWPPACTRDLQWPPFLALWFRKLEHAWKHTPPRICSVPTPPRKRARAFPANQNWQVVQFHDSPDRALPRRFGAPRTSSPPTRSHASPPPPLHSPNQATSTDTCLGRWCCWRRCPTDAYRSLQAALGSPFRYVLRFDPWALGQLQAASVVCGLLAGPLR